MVAMSSYGLLGHFPDLIRCHRINAVEPLLKSLITHSQHEKMHMRRGNVHDTRPASQEYVTYVPIQFARDTNQPK